VGEVCFGERSWSAGVKKGLPRGGEVTGAHDAFGPLPDLKEEHVPAAQELPGMREQEVLHDSRMRDVQNNETAHHFGMKASYRPGDGSAPIMADKAQRLATEVFVERDNVGDEFVE
jgi:hypothetical protein